MPEYGGSGLAQLLRENEQRFLWQVETVAVGELSIAYQLARVPTAYYPWGLSAELSFSAAPGTFEIDIVGSNSDTAASYISLGSISTVNASNFGRWDLTPGLWPRYVAGVVKTLGNAGVLVTLAVTR